MHPTLLRTDQFSISAYSALMFSAVILAVATLMLRARRRPINHNRLVFTLFVALLGGWLGGRVLPSLTQQGLSGLSWNLLLPSTRVGFSLTAFLIVAGPLGFMCLAGERRRILLYLDVMAPSLPIALVLAKLGCLCAGCCAGRQCSPAMGLTYPYGSPVFARQWRDGAVDVAPLLLLADPQGDVRPLRSDAWKWIDPQDPPEILEAHSHQHGVSCAQFLNEARSARSQPVWPVPIWYIAASILLWGVAEMVVRRARRAGRSTGTVLLGYGLIRLVFDAFVASDARIWPGMTSAQLMAIPLCLAGIALLTMPSLFGADCPMSEPIDKTA